MTISVSPAQGLALLHTRIFRVVYKSSSSTIPSNRPSSLGNGLDDGIGQWTTAGFLFMIRAAETCSRISLNCFLSALPRCAACKAVTALPIDTNLLLVRAAARVRAGGGAAAGRSLELNQDVLSDAHANRIERQRERRAVGNPCSASAASALRVERRGEGGGNDALFEGSGV